MQEGKKQMQELLRDTDYVWSYFIILQSVTKITNDGAAKCK